jgi:hypothetical protein
MPYKGDVGLISVTLRMKWWNVGPPKVMCHVLKGQSAMPCAPPVKPPHASSNPSPKDDVKG